LSPACEQPGAHMQEVLGLCHPATPSLGRFPIPRDSREGRGVALKEIVPYGPIGYLHWLTI
jgi:hypothetical protein